MTRKKTSKAPGKRTTVTTEYVDSEQEGLDPFETALEEFGAAEELALQIYRYKEDDPGTPAYVKKIPFNAEFHSLEWIRKQFGPGRYQLRFYTRGQEGRRSRNITVAIDPETIPSSTPAAPPADKELISVLREQNQLFLTSLLSRKGEGGLDSAVLLKLLEGNQTVNTELLKHALVSRGGGGDTMSSILGVVEKFVELTEQHKVESEGGMVGTIRAIARDLAPLFKEIAQSRSAPYIAPTYPMIPAHPPSSPAPTPEVTTSIDVPEPPRAGNGDPTRAAMEQLVRLSADEVLKAARRGDTPEDTADWILGEVAPNYYGVFEGLTYETLVSIEPRYSELDRTWLDRILTELHEAANPAEEQGDQGES